MAPSFSMLSEQEKTDRKRENRSASGRSVSKHKGLDYFHFYQLFIRLETDFLFEGFLNNFSPRPDIMFQQQSSIGKMDLTLKNIIGWTHRQE